MGQGALKEFVAGSLGVAIASPFTLLAITAQSFPDRVARSFTRVTEFSSGLSIESTWLCSFAVLAPALPMLALGFYIGVFDQDFFPDRTGWGPKYSLLGISSGAMALLLLFYSKVGFRCKVSKDTLLWTWTFFGKKLWVKDLKNARMVEYSQRSENGLGGPTPTIEYRVAGGRRKTTKIHFRNLYDISREDFGDLLAYYLGEPERKVEVPTK